VEVDLDVIILFMVPDITKDIDFRTILLTTYMDFTTSEHVFQALARRFGSPEAADSHGGLVTLRTKYVTSHTLWWLLDRIFSIISVLKNWVTGPSSPIEPPALVSIKDFAQSLSSSRIYSLVAEQLVDVINDRVSVSLHLNLLWPLIE
jgi:hypothetical protein